MTDSISLNLIILYLSCISTFFLWIQTSKNTAIIVALIVFILGLIFKFISYPSLILVLIFYLCCKFYLKQQEFTLKKFFLFLILFLIISIVMLHKIPFSNSIPIFTGVRVSSISTPFTMGINIEKFVCAVIMASLLLPISKKRWAEWVIILKEFFSPFLILTFVLIVPAILTNFVKFDFKISTYTLIFSLNNLLIVSFAE